MDKSIRILSTGWLSTATSNMTKGWFEESVVAASGGEHLVGVVRSGNLTSNVSSGNLAAEVRGH
jgi:hypothetical protein